MNSGIYIHIPFCKSFCPYCDFYKVKADEDLMQKYLEAVVNTTASFSHTYDLGKVDSIYFGGGTPSCMKGTDIKRIIDVIKENYDVLDDVEITVECNPSSNLEEFIPTCGANRVSMGLQSACDAERKALGRMADRNLVIESLETIRKAGISNISLDVMMGIPKQTIESLSDTLDFVIESNVPHVSSYMLGIMEGTVFYNRKDTLDLPNEETVCDMYMLCCDKLEAAGIKQYEISNFAKEGFLSRHNKKYWKLAPYLGIGPSAHSFVGSQRFHFDSDINDFLDSPKVILDGKGGTFEERVMLGLRLKEGVFGPFPEDFLEKAKKLKPYVEIMDNNIKLTREGFLVSNSIISELI